MPLSQVSFPDTESARVAVILIIVGVIAFWKLALRVMLAIVVVAIGLGLFVLLQNMHR